MTNSIEARLVRQLKEQLNIDPDSSEYEISEFDITKVEEICSFRRKWEGEIYLIKAGKETAFKFFMEDGDYSDGYKCEFAEKEICMH